MTRNAFLVTYSRMVSKPEVRYKRRGSRFVTGSRPMFIDVYRATAVPANAGRAGSTSRWTGARSVTAASSAPKASWWRHVLLRFADHQNGERSRYRRALRGAAAGGRCRSSRRRRSTLLRHREQVAGLAVETDGTSAVHGLQVLLHLKAGWALLFRSSWSRCRAC
jgi:hypothetical protein